MWTTVSEDNDLAILVSICHPLFPQEFESARRPCDVLITTE
jgi:hypothetical protein